MVDGERRGDAWLHQSVTFHPPTIASAERGPVDRMRHRADQPGGSPSRQARVCIERDYVTNTREVWGRLPAEGHKRCACRTAQKLVQFMQFPPLSLPAHPFTVG